MSETKTPERRIYYEKTYQNFIDTVRGSSADDWKFYDGLRGHWLAAGRPGTIMTKTGIRLPLPGKNPAMTGSGWMKTERWQSASW